MTLIAGAKTILKTVHRLLQNKSFPLDLFIVEKAKNAAHDGCLIHLSFFFHFTFTKITSMTNLIYTIHQQ